MKVSKSTKKESKNQVNNHNQWQWRRHWPSEKTESWFTAVIYPSFQLFLSLFQLFSLFLHLFHHLLNWSSGNQILQAKHQSQEQVKSKDQWQPRHFGLGWKHGHEFS